MQTASYILRYVYEHILELLFPIYCIKCKKKNTIICNSCEQTLLKVNTNYENIYSVYDYRDKSVRDLIWQMKYHKKRNIGETLGVLLYENTKEELAEIHLMNLGGSICVIPVPISDKRKKERGYNQTENIAEGFCKQNPSFLKPCIDIVYKKIDTLPQAKISNRNKRLKNMKDVFAIKDKNKVKNRTFIIIDDVTTTGATLNEIRKLLLRHKARDVYAFAIAH